MLLFFALTLGIALSVPGIVLAIRALPPVGRLVERGIKPWACDVCSCFWITGMLGLGVGREFGWAYIAVCGPAYTLAMILLSHLERPTTLPPMPDYVPSATPLADELERP